ncbi:MAG: hypothetical protein R6V48_04950, partial [Fidelibacterota bacterium]
AGQPRTMPSSGWPGCTASGPFGGRAQGGVGAEEGLRGALAFGVSDKHPSRIGPGGVSGRSATAIFIQ